MNCNQFESLLEQMEGHELAISQDAAQHASKCTNCASLKSDLELILNTAQDLTDEHEPPARLWQNIEYTLRMEGVIRDAAVAAPAVTRPRWFAFPRWAMAASAALILGVGGLVYTQLSVVNVAGPVAPPQVKPPKPGAVLMADKDFDDQFLAELEKSSPTMKPVYAKNLQNVNKYIAEAQKAVDENPSDAEAQALLRDAQSQKAMMIDVATSQSMR